MQNQHPSTEQLAGYLDAPEAATQSEVRHHLMACQQCRVRIDQLTQLELDIKHYAPRFAGPAPISDGSDQAIESYLDNGANLQVNEQQDAENRIKSDPAALRAALHYAVHSSAMKRGIDPATFGNVSQQTSTGNHAATRHRLKEWLTRMIRPLRQPVPLWAMAPASLALAIVVGIGVFYSDGAGNRTGRLVAFQDNPTMTFQQPGAPAGSIGFFHDAQAQRKPFSGMTIATNNNGDLTFRWPAITNATRYQLEIFTIVNNDQQLLKETTTTARTVTLQNVTLSDKQHYQWHLSGKTRDNMIFKTSGDFLYLQNP